MTVRHKNLTDPALHESKGVSTAASGAVFVANGTGSGSHSNSLTELENIKLKAANAQWTDMVVPLVTQTVPAGLTAATITKVADDSAGTSIGVWAPAFSAAATNDMIGQVQVPHGYVAGSAIRPHIHWVGSATSAGNVVWELEYLITNVGVAFTDSVKDRQTIAFGGTTAVPQVDAFTEIAGTSIGESSVILCRVSRIGGDGADTYAGTGLLLSFDFHFQVEKLGSITEITNG